MLRFYRLQQNKHFHTFYNFVHLNLFNNMADFNL